MKNNKFDLNSNSELSIDQSRRVESDITRRYSRNPFWLFGRMSSEIQTKRLSQGNSIFVLPLCVVGIYASFLTWALVQEPLTTKVWPHSHERFQYPNVIAVCQATVAMIIGFLYLKWKQSKYDPINLIKDHAKQLALISFTQSTSTPLATYSLQYVDYLTYMLAKSCKMIPVLLVHLLIYRSQISKEKKIVAVLVSLGVTIFTMGGSQPSKKHISHGGLDSGDVPTWVGFGLLGISLFLDGLTNATQDTMLKKSRANELTEKNIKTEKTDKTITGAHLMFALNMFIILWNLPYLGIFHKNQILDALNVIELDPQVLFYLFIYSLCGAVGQCFIFFTLEQYGSLVLIMITVTRKLISMLLSIVVFGKSVNLTQWVGILIVFGGIIWEAINKKAAITSKAKKDK